jgi:perosamine synthetase
MNTSSRIQYTQPSITDLEINYANDAVTNGWGEHCYDYIKRFEASFRQHLGVDFAIATSSCTGALHMGMSALGIGQDDEVILADINWIADAAAISYLGATPVFVDIDPLTWCLDPKCAAAAITPRTKAIIATHLYGNPCDMDALTKLAEQHDIALIEDTAEAIGAVWQGRRCGSIGTFGTFSFHGTKTMTTGEGGMFVTNDPDLYETVLTLSNHGRDRRQTRQFWSDLIGFKYKMSNVQAAIGCAQIERIDELIIRKRKIFANYAQRIGAIDGLSMNSEPPGTQNGYWMPTVVFAAETGINRDRALAAFAAQNIDARVFFNPLSSLPMFDSVPSNTVSYDISSRAINLPSYHDMSESQQDTIIQVIEELLR